MFFPSGLIIVKPFLVLLFNPLIVAFLSVSLKSELLTIASASSKLSTIVKSGLTFLSMLACSKANSVLYISTALSCIS